MSKRLKRELAAAVIVDALFSTDKAACERYGISLRSLQNYRQKLAEDEELALIFARKKAEFDKTWVDGLPGALRSAIQFIADSSEAARADPNYKKNPMVIQAIAGAMKLCADVYLTSRVVEARLREGSDAGLTDPDRSSDELLKQIPASAPAN